MTKCDYCKKEVKDSQIHTRYNPFDFPIDKTCNRCMDKRVHEWCDWCKKPFGNKTTVVRDWATVDISHFCKKCLKKELK